MGEKYQLVIEDTGKGVVALRLRGLLKVALRRFGFRAVEILPALEAEARERQSHGETAPGKSLPQKIAGASLEGEAREQAARICSTNRQDGRG